MKVLVTSFFPDGGTDFDVVTAVIAHNESFCNEVGSEMLRFGFAEGRIFDDMSPSSTCGRQCFQSIKTTASKARSRLMVGGLPFQHSN